MAITKRLVKGSALTHTELDANFTDLDGRATANAAAIVALDTRTDALEATMYSHGFEDYNNTGASQALIAGTAVKLTNNGLGAFTNTSYKIPGRGAIWDTSTNQFNWDTAGLVLGDTALIRMDLTVTSSGANDGFSVDIDLAVGSGSGYSLNADYREYRTAGTYAWTGIIEVYMGDTNTLNFPAELMITSDSASDSVQYNGHYVKYSLRTPSIN